MQEVLPRMYPQFRLHSAFDQAARMGDDVADVRKILDTTTSRAHRTRLARVAYEALPLRSSLAR